MASEKITKAIYGDKYIIVHDPNAKGRAPRYIVKATADEVEIKPPGVTTILGQTLSKDLVQWAVDCAIDHLKVKLPKKITTADLAEASKAYATKRDKGASTGTEAHALVEKYLKGKEPVIEEATQEAQNSFLAFLDWFTKVNPEVLGVEQVVYSEMLGYAGTFDCMLRINGKNYLCDLKTTNASRRAPRGVYPEMFFQLGAYYTAHLEQRIYEVNEAGGTELPGIDGLMVISAKKDGILDIVTNEDVGLSIYECAETFAFVMGIYDRTKQLNQVLGGK